MVLQINFFFEKIDQNNTLWPKHLFEPLATMRTSVQELQVFFWADIFLQVRKIFFSITKLLLTFLSHSTTKKNLPLSESLLKNSKSFSEQTISTKSGKYFFLFQTHSRNSSLPSWWIWWCLEVGTVEWTDANLDVASIFIGIVFLWVKQRLPRWRILTQAAAAAASLQPLLRTVYPL